MNVSYFAPVQRSWDRTRRMLFAPFRIETWFVLGFAAFLSEWFTGGSGGGGGNGGGRTGFRGRAEDFEPIIDKARDFFQNPVYMGIILWIVAAVVAIIVLFQWIGSHGKFVYLDCVVRGRAAIREPWSRTGSLGDSLFLCRVVMVLVSAALLIGLGLVTVGAGLRELFLGREDPIAVLAPMIGGFLLLLCLGMLIGFVFLLLDAFVVPIMYRHDIGASAAWGRFLPLFGAHPISFLVFAVVMFVLYLLTLALVVMVGLSTCCVGFALMAIPYIGQVVLLPIHTLFRGLGPEFLAQFGPEYDVFATPAPGAPMAPAPAGPPA